MAVTKAVILNKSRLWNALLTKWGVKSVEQSISRMSIQYGVTDGGADLTLTLAEKGDIIFDSDNDDYYLVTVDATTVIALNS